MLVSSRPLWLDEVIQLWATSGGSLGSLWERLFQNAGGAPLGYLEQYWLVSMAGVNVWTARLPSVMAGVGSVVLLAVVGRQLGLSRLTTLLGSALWALCPLCVRYSLEGRPYMQALLFALGAVAAHLQFGKTGKVRWALVLTGCLSAAVYSQPFAIFAPLGFSMCAVWWRREAKMVGLTLGPYAVAGLSFLPWLMAARAHWHASIATGPGGFDWSTDLGLVLVRECMGDGYAAAVPAILLAGVCAFAAMRRPLEDRRVALLSAVVSTVVLALVADAAFDYFFAIRQVIYMAPFLLLLAAEGAGMAWERPRWRAMAVVLILIFAVGAMAKNYRHLTDRAEDWSRLAGQVSDAVGDGCILMPQSDSAALYTVFRPEIAQRLCDSTLSGRVVVPSHRYTDPRAARLAEDTVLAQGMVRVSSTTVGFGTVEVFGRQQSR